ncbi:MAG TPA: hypothetical protein DEO33_00550 [Rikenellaceae bacterium]|jgi:hypothetical protein|nr:hypothetical protein [Bacteroidales bacterium]HBZ34909.1 hypothetical protein [Rikenellaceae bacterium]
MLKRSFETTSFLILLIIAVLPSALILERNNVVDFNVEQDSLIMSAYTFSPSLSSDGMRQFSSEPTIPVVSAPWNLIVSPSLYQKILAYSLCRERIIGKLNRKIEQHFIALVNVLYAPSSDFFIYTLRKIVI